MRASLAHSLIIKCTPEDAWRLLADFANYSEWNPFIRNISGSIIEGERLSVTVQPPGQGAMTFKPRVLTAKPNEEFSWLGHFLVPGIFDGEHSFRIEVIDSETIRFTQSEKFFGILIPFVGSVLRKTELGFQAMNEAFKHRLENRS